MQKPTADNHFLADHVALLASSFLRLTGNPLPALHGESKDPARAVFYSPLAVVSHNTAKDPVFNYANSTALIAFEMDWDDFIRLPSRRSAEAVDREQRQQLMQQARQNGFVSGYRGLRISATGKRFWIKNGTIWNLIDENGIFHGQAAIFESEANT